jgi:uncharacterized protein YdbL (DUF1318 family)
LSFTESAAASSTENLFQIAFSATDNSNASLALNRLANGSYRLGFFENSGGSSWQSGATIDAAYLGTTNGQGSASDQLYLELSLTKGATAPDWTAYCALYNLADDPDMERPMGAFVFDFAASGAFFHNPLTPVLNSAAQSAANVSNLSLKSVDFAWSDPIDNYSPLFNTDIIVKANGMEDMPYSASLAGDASDPESDPLTFEKVAGRGWLTVAENGDLSGTPGSWPVGMNTFTIKVSDGKGGSSQATLKVTVDPASVTQTVTSQTTIDGTVSGSIGTVSTSNNVYQTLTEINSGTTSILEHVWQFNNVSGAEVVTFYVEAHHTVNSEGDDFIFSYSTDGVNYTEMVTVSKTSDNNTAQYYTLPSGTSGTVYIRVHDADAVPGHTQLDSIFIDQLVIVSETSTVAPTAASQPFPGNGADNVGLTADLFWTAGRYAASHDVYFGTSATPAFQSNESLPSFEPGTLQNDTTYYWSIDEINTTGTTAGPVWSFTTKAPQLASTQINNVGSGWQTVNLQNTYVSPPVVVATVVLEDASDLPAVVRIRNVTTNSLQLRVQNPSNTSLSGYTVHLLTVEEGVYTQAEHGVNLEAIKVLSQGINTASDWSASRMEQINPANAYSSPVVLGQVMSAQAWNWSSFWASDGTQGNPPSASAIYVGQHVGQDPSTARSYDTLGVIIVESGAWTLDGVGFTAGVGGNSIQGVDNAPAYTYSLSGLSSSSQAVVSAAGMNGADGGWPVLFGTSPVSSTNLNLAFDEDQIGDAERMHVAEQVSYLVLE